MNKTTLFIGCSSEALPLARAIDQQLKHKITTTIWEEAKKESSILSKIIEAIKTTDFGLFIFYEDLQTVNNGVGAYITTTNVILETGMFLGNKESANQLILLKPKDTENFTIPSDISNIITIDYDLSLIKSQDNNNDTLLDSLIKKITDKIDSMDKPKKRLKIETIDTTLSTTEAYKIPCLSNIDTSILKIIYENILSKKYPLICYNQLIDLNERYEISKNLKITLSKLEREKIIEIIQNNCAGSQNCKYIAINDERIDFIDNLFL